jgi:hypothetical protein
MFIRLLAQASSSSDKLIAPQDRALISLVLIVALLGLGVLMTIGLIAAWRNHNRRQREIEQEHAERENDLPRPDAWATAAQRMSPEDAAPDEAHISGFPAEEDDDARPGADGNYPDEDDDDGDDFPFADDNDDDDDGPIGT